MKDTIRQGYEMAKLNAYFVGMAISGKDIPTIEEVYPSLFNIQNASDEEEQRQMMLYKEQFKDYAKEFNAHRHKGG